jgi:hypothetical protein
VRKARAVHDPGKVLLDVALAVALGGYCLADVGMLRAEPATFGPVACGEKAIGSARAEARERVWRSAARKAPDAGGMVTVDLDVLGHQSIGGHPETIAERGMGCSTEPI